jgi:hypothetical protein
VSTSSSRALTSPSSSEYGTDSQGKERKICSHQKNKNGTTSQHMRQQANNKREGGEPGDLIEERASHSHKK